jgi:hypothetical protein
VKVDLDGLATEVSALQRRVSALEAGTLGGIVGKLDGRRQRPKAAAADLGGFLAIPFKSRTRRSAAPGRATGGCYVPPPVRHPVFGLLAKAASPLAALWRSWRLSK